MSHSTLLKRAAKEKWTELRNNAGIKIDTKTIEKISEEQSKKAVNLNDIADILADRIKALAEKAEDADTIKKLTSAAKDIRDIKGIKTDADLREQEARIRKLEQETKEQRDTRVIVQFEEDMTRWSK